MKYFITDTKSKEEKYSWNKLGIYCYDLRYLDDHWTEIYSIENLVIVNHYGCLLTNEEIKLGKEYPNDFMLFEEFKKNIEDYGVIDLSNEEMIDYELLVRMKLTKKDFKLIKKKSLKAQEKYICNYYHSNADFVLIHKYDSVYQIIHLLRNTYA